MAALTPLIELYRYTLQPIAPFTWFDLGVSTLDVVAAFRLCLILRQMREMLHAMHVMQSKSTKASPKGPIEEKSFVMNLATTLIVVYGGEAVAAPLLGVPASFMLSGVFPGLYAGVQAVIDYLPVVPSISAQLELPLSFVDGLTRAYLLCNLIPPSVTTHSSAAIASSPWTLLVASLTIANGGFFIVNLFSFLNPTALCVQTPPELQPYGWSTADLWCAPATTGLYALLTHAQPFWATAHGFVAGVLGGGVDVKPVDAETARAICALLLSTVFVGRTTKNFGLWKRDIEKKEKTH